MGKHFDFVTTPKTDYPKGQYLADFLTEKAVVVRRINPTRIVAPAAVRLDQKARNRVIAGPIGILVHPASFRTPLA